MKRIISKLFLVFIFILNLFFMQCYAQSMNITSVVFDDSASFLALNTFDNFDTAFSPKPQLTVDEVNKIAYFDLQPALINGSAKDYVIDSDNIIEVHVTQISRMPDIVRVSLNYSDNFSPSDIGLKKLNNTLFVTFERPKPTNYYFQEVYKESGTNPLYENINIHRKLYQSKNTIGEINSAFVSNANQNSQNILATKALMLRSKYYIDSVTLKGTTPIIHGIGTYTLAKPVHLANPSRLVLDINNAVVNPVLRNKDIALGTDVLRIGQFNSSTARIVIKTPNPEKYIPVIYDDTQKLAILNTKTTSPLNLYFSTVNMIGVTSEKGDKFNYSMKLAFSNPLIFGVSRTSDKFELYLYNVDNYYSGAIKSELRKTPFETLEMTDIKNGGAKFSLPVKSGYEADVYLGSNGKTLRIKLHIPSEYKPVVENVEQEIKVTPVTLPAVTKRKHDGKRYVVIDAGHGGTDYGALRNGINEKDITLDVSKRVEKMLRNKGYVVSMTRTNDTYVSLKDRVAISERVNPDIFVSIHVNSSNSDSPTGLETHYYKDNSLLLAKCIHAAMLNNVKSKDRGLFKSRFYVINHTKAPAVLAEIGFISNAWERGQLVTEARKNATAKAIVEGIDDYFRRK